MKTTNLNNGQGNKKQVIFVNFTNTKRLQWDRFRRYGIFTA